MAKNITALLSLCELSDDVEIVNAAAMGLDLCLVDMAAHYHQGAYVAPHGRTYKKDKMTARDEDTFDVAKLLFGRTRGEHESVDSSTAAALRRDDRSDPRRRFHYRDYTHAYFPQDHFDEVRQVGNWTLGRATTGRSPSSRPPSPPTNPRCRAIVRSELDLARQR